MQTAKDHLEKALKEASREGCAVTEAELAEHHYKLGRILWTMGGNMRDDPTMARGHFEAASKEECDSQVSTLPCSMQAPGTVNRTSLIVTIMRSSLKTPCTARPPLSAQVSMRYYVKPHSHGRFPHRLRASVLCQADACAWLGHWYKDINQNWFKARNCYKRALALQPDSIMIGEHLFVVLPL